jgi:hypothetical protein
MLSNFFDEFHAIIDNEEFHFTDTTNLSLLVYSHNRLYDVNLSISSIQTNFDIINVKCYNKKTIEELLINTFIDIKSRSNIAVFYEHDNTYFEIKIKGIISEKSLFIANKKRSSDISNDQKILNIIEDAGPKGISQSLLTKKTHKFINKKDQKDIIQDLIVNNIITMEFDKSNGRKKTIYKY